MKYYLTMEQADLRYWRKHHPRAAQAPTWRSGACTTSPPPQPGSRVARAPRRALGAQGARPREQPGLAEPVARGPLASDAYTSLPSPWVSTRRPCQISGSGKSGLIRNFTPVRRAHSCANQLVSSQVHGSPKPAPTGNRARSAPDRQPGQQPECRRIVAPRKRGRRSRRPADPA